MGCDMKKSSRLFDDVARERNLKKFLASEIGTLYYGSNADGRVIVRKFSPLEVASVYGEVVDSFSAWASKVPDFSGAILILPMQELGVDFSLRNHQIYTATAELRDEESAFELPDVFFQKIRAVEMALKVGGATARENILRSIMTNSVVHPSGKTYFDFSIQQFVIVEPKITLDDLDAWASL